MKKFNWASYIEHTEPIYTKLAVGYDIHPEEAVDLVYDAYKLILEKGNRPTFNLGYTIVKNLANNLVRDRDRCMTKAHHINEAALVGSISEVCGYPLPIVSARDFNEVLIYMQKYLPGDDYTFIMTYAFGTSYKDLAKKFSISVSQAKYRMRIIRAHLNYIFPHILEEL